MGALDIISPNPVTRFRGWAEDLVATLTGDPPRKGRPDVLYHYTTVSTAQKILDANELWAKDLRAMDDKRELEHGKEVYLEIIGEASLEAKGVRSEFLEQLPGLCSPFDTGDIYETFVTSLSKDGDGDKLWKEHGDRGRGCALAFHVRGLEELEPPRIKAWKPGPWPVVYSPDEQRERVAEAISRMGDLVEEYADQYPHHVDLWPGKAARILRTFFGRQKYLFKDPNLDWEKEYRMSIFRARDREWDSEDVRSSPQDWRYVPLRASSSSAQFMKHGLPPVGIVPGPQTPADDHRALEEVAARFDCNVADASSIEKQIANASR
jgi:hypothetical protein